MLPDHVTSQKAFTLLEVLISIFILVTVLSTVFASYTGTFRIIDETESQAEAYRMARIAIERIKEDLESVYTYIPETSTNESGFEQPDEPVGGEALRFEGEPDRLRFPTSAHVEFGEETGSEGIAVVSYETREDTSALVTGRFFLNRKDELLNDIIQSEITGNTLEDPPAHPICKDLVAHEDADGVKFTYFDEEDEEDHRWDSTEDNGGFPKRVQVELHFANPSEGGAPFTFVFSVALQSRSASKDDPF